MISATSLQNLFGIKTSETRTVGLFLLHNFLLGIGSVLVYVAANVLLLEHNPEHSLPLGYIFGALAMMAVGKVYTHFEHHLLLKKLAVRVLLAVVALTGAMGVLVAVGHSVAAAVAIMAGYRVIYLLTNLEFWGVSAVVFDVRQSKRLFSIISSGDMPAKALGAILAALIHGDAQLPVLLGVSFLAYLGALFTLRSTLNSHEVEATARPVRRTQRKPGKLVRQLFGGSELVFAMCLSLVGISAVISGVEYMFFIHVKHKFHEAEDVTKSVGWILAFTYLAATFFKLLVSRQALDRYGVQWSLRLLPVVALVCLAVFGGLKVAHGYTQTEQLAFYCGLYLLLEVLRRTVFDPVFLVLFQPLAPQLRLAAHTLAKGFYEPLGMGLTGLLFFAFRYSGLLDGGLPFLWMGMGLLLTLLFLRRTYVSYLAELKEGLGRRFTETAELALPDAALQVVLAHLHSAVPTEVLNAVAWLRQHKPAALHHAAPALLEHADERVRLALLATPEAHSLDFNILMGLAQADSSPAVRETAAGWAVIAKPADAAHAAQNLLLASKDMATRQGAIRGCLVANAGNVAARQSLNALLHDAQPEAQRLALALLAFFHLETQNQLVEKSLASHEPAITRATLVAIGTVGHTKLAHHLFAALRHKHLWQPAADSLVALGAAVVPLVREALHREPGNVLTHRLTTVLERLDAPASRAALVELAQGRNLFSRGMALRALRHFLAIPADERTFERLLREEFALAAQLLQGLVAAPHPDFQAAVEYELMLVHQRVFGLLAQLYDAELVATAQRNVAHAGRERQANALEILDNLIPRPIYQGLQALLDDTPVAEKARLFAMLTAPDTPARAHLFMPMGNAAAAGSALVAEELLPEEALPEALPALLLHRGPTAFTTWTLSVALRHWQPLEANAATLLRPYLHSASALLFESAQLAAAALAAQLGQSLPNLLSSFSPMSHAPDHAEARISALERVVVLKSTALFAHTPENVLSSIVPIMKEVTFHEGQEIFAKGDIGTSLFILHDGQVGIFNGSQQLATFGPGDFFGELALLDTEPRSATAATLSEVLAFRIDQEDFYDVMEERAEVLRNILRMLCQRIRLQNEKMRELAG